MTDSTAQRVTPGRAIREARQRLRLSQEELAERLGATRRQVIRWEQDQNTPSEEYIVRLMDTLELTREQLEPDTEERYRRRLEDRMRALEARSADLEQAVLSQLEAIEARLREHIRESREIGEQILRVVESATDQKRGPTRSGDR